VPRTDWVSNNNDDREASVSNMDATVPRRCVCACSSSNYVRSGATENAGVEKSAANRRGGKCRSRLAAWKVEPILYSDTALSYFLKIVFRLLSE